MCVTEKQEHPQNPKEPSRAKGTETQVAPKRTWASGIPLSYNGEQLELPAEPGVSGLLSPAQLSYQSLG